MVSVKEPSSLSQFQFGKKGSGSKKKRPVIKPRNITGPLAGGKRCERKGSLSSVKERSQFKVVGFIDSVLMSWERGGG